MTLHILWSWLLGFISLFFTVCVIFRRITLNLGRVEEIPFQLVAVTLMINNPLVTVGSARLDLSTAPHLQHK